MFFCKNNRGSFLKNRRKGRTILSHIQHHVIAQISGRIYGVAGYYSENDATQHVVVATHDGTLYEVHWNRITPFTSPQKLAQFPGIASLSGFFTPDDGFQHVVVETEDGWLHELYFTNLQHVQSRDLLQIASSAGPHIGMAGSYSSDDGLRHVAVGTNENILYEVAWSAQVVPEVRSVATQFTLPDVAAIAGFFDLSVHSQDVIVALKGGDVYDVHYSGGIVSSGGQTTTDLVTTFFPSLVNVAAFVSSDTTVRHIILLDASGQVYDYSYIKDPLQLFGTTSLIPPLDNVVDMAGYYSYYDSTNHVILVTSDGNVHEVYYS
jgi:hypothetical protein